jgi:hypothetical protein
MGKCVVLKQNSPEIRKRIEDAGISLCPCASFDDNSWLDYHVGLGAYFDVHGLGYDSEEMSAEEYKSLFLYETKPEDIVWCNNVDEFIRLIKELEESNK